MNAAEQSSIFADHLTTLIAGTDDEWPDAVIAMASTVTDRHTYFALIYALGCTFAQEVEALTKRGRTAVIAHDLLNKDDKHALTWVSKFLQSCNPNDPTSADHAHALFTAWEEQQGAHIRESASSVLFHIAYTVHQAGQQLIQAQIDLGEIPRD